MCQMLYTAHWAMAWPETAASFSAQGLSKIQKTLAAPASLSTAPGQGFRPVHIHHPCTLWIRRTLANYMWGCKLGLELCREFEFRFGHTHTCLAHLLWLLANPPPGIRNWPLSRWAIAMDAQYICSSDAVECYRHFYKVSKGQRGLLKYTRRERPAWLSND